jgi:3-oxoacyl-[acyl-carrier-protein] synthase II
VSASSPCKELALSAARAGLFAPDGAVRVFDREAKGTAWGEAAAAVILERPEDARARGASVKAWLQAQASAFAAEPQARASALTRAASAALRAAGVSAASVTLASSGADGSPATDAAEARALLAALGSDASAPVMAVKSGLGDCLDTSGLVQVLLAAEALRSTRAPEVAALATPQVSGLRYAAKDTAVRRGAALATATSATGSCSALVLSVDDAA